MRDNWGKAQSLRKALTIYDLLDSEEPQTAMQLGSPVGVKPRAVREYIAAFRDFGWPIESLHAKGYRRETESLNLSLSEGDLFLLAILLAEAGSALPTEQAARLSRKLVTALRSDSRARVEALRQRVESPPSKSPGLQDFETVSAVGRCLSDPRCSLTIWYQKFDEPEAHKREIVPLKFRHQDGWFYVDSWDLQKREQRNFRIDRITRCAVLQHPNSVPRPDGGTGQTHKWDFGDSAPVLVTLELSPELSAWLKENPQHPSQELEGNRVRYSVRRLDLLTDWVMGLRGARVIEPDEVRTMVRDRAKALFEEGGTLEISW